MTHNAHHRVHASTDNEIHWTGPGLMGWGTLCGHIDIVGCVYTPTIAPVNCKGCLSVCDHAKTCR